MTLLEAVLATVLLAVVAVACLDGTGAAARLQRQSVEQVRTVSMAAAAMESARLGLPVAPTARVERHPYRPDAALAARSTLDRLEVEVIGPDGRLERLVRLVPAIGTRAGITGGPGGAR